MRRKYTRDRRKTECDRLRLRSIDELVGGDEHRGDATQFKIVNVVHTARRATASIRQSLDDHLTFRGDLVAEVNRRWLRERGFYVAFDVGSDAN